MFIENESIYRPGIKAELIVWETIKKNFNNRDAFGYLHYPMFGKNGDKKREIDILLNDIELGMSVIEVKGINIYQIKAIEGHKWHYINYYTSIGDPFNQAEQQLNMLCDDIEEEPNLYRAFNKRAVVALPYVTKRQWEERGFQKSINNPPILFKDDIESGNIITRLKEINLYYKKGQLSKEKWNYFKSYFKKNFDNKSTFSKSYFINKIDDFEAQKFEIESDLSNGVRVYIFSTNQISGEWVKKNSSFIEKFQLQIYFSDEEDFNLDIDSLDNSNLDYGVYNKAQLSAFRNFNLNQFLAVHQPQDNSIIVKAGAGTGKTHVMIDRVLYLLETANVEMSDIVMITFTQASTNEMRQRLQEKFISLYELSGKSRYLQYLEEIKNIQISTIHAFSKKILTSLSHEIGYGKNVTVRQYLNEKNIIVENLIDEFFHYESSTVIEDMKVKPYELARWIKTIWEEFEKKGLTSEEIKQLDWGTCEDEVEILNQLFQYVFERCEERLENIKIKNNAISMGDLIRKLRIFTKEKKLSEFESDKYLFIDEFQDSDNIQIELVTSLQTVLNYKLFVVGDIKQSIYRFRGADYTSFERLEQNSAQGFAYISLNKNYRTTKHLLEKMDIIFTEWGRETYGGKGTCLLPYSDEDRLVSSGENENKEHPLQIIKLKDKKDQVFQSILIEHTEEMKKMSSSTKYKNIAIIVRTNKQAIKIKELCTKSGISTTQNLDGTFYKSEAVKHFKYLLDALLYPNNSKFLINLMQTPFLNYSLKGHFLRDAASISDNRYSRLISSIDFEIANYVSDLKRLSVLAVVQKIIVNQDLDSKLPNYYIEQGINQEVVEPMVKQYTRNLYHLMNIIQSNFSTKNMTLWDLHEWLSIQIRTNRNENEPVITESKDTVDIYTVHRAKGLEFDTVIMPDLTKTFVLDNNFKKEEVYVQEETENDEYTKKVGWRFNSMENIHYRLLSEYENIETIKEETRLLYVAMTRAKSSLIMLSPPNVRDNTWASLIDKYREQV